MKTTKIAVVLVAGLSAFALQGPAFAASPLTDSFLAKVADNAAFLEGASRIALDRAASPSVRAYAHSEVVEASALSRTIDGATPTPAADDEGTLRTGRSVGLDAPAVSEDPDKADLQRAKADEASRQTAASQADGRAPLGQAEIVNLRTLRGAAFDAAYRATQRAALGQIEAAYRSYLSHGDDAGLKDLAKRELPAVTARLAALTRV